MESTAICAYNGSLRTIPTVVREPHHNRGNDYALENMTQDIALAESVQPEESRRQT